MKLGYFSIKTRPGGIDIYIERFTKALQKKGYEVITKSVGQQYELFPLPVFFKKFKKVDVIFSNAEFGWAFKRRKTSLVLVLHNFIFDESYQRYTSLLQKIYHYLILRFNLNLSIRMSDKILCISDYYKSKLIDKFYFAESKCIRIHHWIDTNKFRPLNRKRKTDKTKLLFVGNLTKRKGVDLLPKIMDLLGPDYDLYVTGGLDEIPIDFNRGNIKFVGRKEEQDLIKLYNECDIFLFPSRLEGFGYPVLEAMACGLPVVCTNYSALPELVDDGLGGFLCGMDDVKDFVSKIEKIAKNRKLSLAMGKFNREKVEKFFSEDTIMSQYTKLLKEIQNEVK